MVHRKFKIILLDLSFNYIENCLSGVLHDSVLLEWTFRFIEYCLMGFPILLGITCGLFSLSGGGRQTTLFSGPGEYSPWRPGSTPFPLGTGTVPQEAQCTRFPKFRETAHLGFLRCPDFHGGEKRNNTHRPPFVVADFGAHISDWRLQGPEVSVPDLGPRNTRVFPRLKT